MDGLISRLNKIDDNNSLRMRTTPESCKPQKYLREDTDDAVDTEGLEACMEKVVKEVIRTLRLDVSVKSVTGDLWRDHHRPPWNNWDCKIIAEKGANTIIRHSWQNSPEPTVHVDLYDLPKNCQITETLILERYKEAIAKELLGTFISLDVWKEREVLYDQKEMEISKIIDRLESKYRGVTLQYEPLTSMEDYCSPVRLFSDTIEIDVYVRAISGKSGSLRVNSRSASRRDYGKYTVDGKTTQVRVSMSPYYGLVYYRFDDADRAEWEREVSLNIEEFIKRIDAIDYAVKNEAILEKQLNEYLMKLQRYYPDATLSAVKKCDVNTLGSFVIYYTEGNYTENVCTISLEELADFDDARKQLRYALKTLRRKIR